jgi:putative transcriptional regulator
MANGKPPLSAAAKAALDAVDWARIDAMTDADIDRQIKANPDAADLGDVAPEKIYRYHRPTGLSTKRIRERLGLSQVAFAARFGFSVGSVRDWEQGRGDPDTAAQTLLAVIDCDPDLVADIVQRIQAA